MKISYELQPETTEACARLSQMCAGSVAFQSHGISVSHGEPLLVAIDGLLRYAKAHKKRYETPLAEDHVLGPLWLQTAKGIRGLLDGDGAVALELGRTTDSKDNGTIETIFWHAMAAAGFGEGDL